MASPRPAFESCLDVAAFDPAPYSGRIEQVLAEGFRVVTFDQVRSPEQEYQLYELIQALDRDVPDAGDWDPLPYADWRRHFLDSPRTFPEGCLIAVAPNGTWAGVSALMRSPGEPDRATVDYTGVLRPYRGRGLAMALKLAGIDLARGHGISRIATENHSLNQPMLAINRRLGFQPLAGTYALSKPFTSLVRS